MKGLTVFGLILSGLYLLFTLAFFIASNSTFESIGPNGWGDFLAGVFGPLAFLWLLLGFFQQGEALTRQGEELNASVKALEFQAKELSATVRQHEQMVKIQREALEYEKQREIRHSQRDTLESTPRFEISIEPQYFGGKIKHSSVLTIQNFRAKPLNTTAYLPLNLFDEFKIEIDFENSPSRQYVVILSWKTKDRPTSIPITLKWNTESGFKDEKIFKLEDVEGKQRTWLVR